MFGVFRGWIHRGRGRGWELSTNLNCSQVSKNCKCKSSGAVREVLPMWKCCQVQCCRLPMRGRVARRCEILPRVGGNDEENRTRRDILAGAWRGDPATRGALVLALPIEEERFPNVAFRKMMQFFCFINRKMMQISLDRTSEMMHFYRRSDAKG